ncbi:MAG TPA: rhomboid family intramembrane serine protease [Bacteroidales bacterium]|nr:rhomboid family intramembrane serine protease [Bacteroidales bacterium]
MNNSSIDIEVKRLKISIEVATLFSMFIWLVKLIEIIEGEPFFQHGLLPRSFSGLLGIFTAPLIHSDFNHLLNNTITIFILITGLVYFYRDLWYKILLMSWLLSGMMVWIAARTSYHIGCSGLIYAIASFIFFSGVIRKNINLMAISLLVIFLYGGLIWGVLPIFPQISWEYHLFGGVTGAILALIYRKQGPPPQTWSWMNETPEDNDDIPEYWDTEIFDNSDKKKL